MEKQENVEISTFYCFFICFCIKYKNAVFSRVSEIEKVKIQTRCYKIVIKNKLHMLKNVMNIV